jgi:hypothetical protein
MIFQRKSFFLLAKNLGASKLPSEAATPYILIKKEKDDSEHLAEGRN